MPRARVESASLEAFKHCSDRALEDVFEIDSVYGKGEACLQEILQFLRGIP